MTMKIRLQHRKGRMNIAKPRDMYEPEFRKGNGALHMRITNDLERREKEYQQKSGRGY